MMRLDRLDWANDVCHHLTGNSPLFTVERAPARAPELEDDDIY